MVRGSLGGGGENLKVEEYIRWRDLTPRSVVVVVTKAHVLVYQREMEMMEMK